MSAPFFSWLSRADFYASAHAQAVALPERGATWLDVGCGPGLVARLAAARGFSVRGVDASPQMVEAARAAGGPARFEVARLEEVTGHADVVSAASLLTVLPDRSEALGQLWRRVAPGGALLVIETTARMRWHATLPHLHGSGALGLLLWGLVRQGRTAAPALDTFAPEGLQARSFHPLLGGLLGAWQFTRRPLELPPC
jgi:2-polyprenyl-3-methyl-5-hydroxy-6-metoxy-1,4-benzoquinol methylase